MDLPKFIVIQWVFFFHTRISLVCLRCRPKSSFTSVSPPRFTTKMTTYGFRTVSYLDLPDLWKLSSLNSPFLSSLTADPVLHFQRRWLVSPSRVNHGLFGKSKEGHLLRPSVVDLVRRGVMKGLGIERRRRMGMYIYTLDVSLFSNDPGIHIANFSWYPECFTV